MKIIASKDFTLDREFYFAGDEVKIKDFDKIVKLNEKGFINPLTLKELVQIKKELNAPKKYNKEEE